MASNNSDASADSWRKVAKETIAGTLSSSVAVVAFQPLDTVKVRLQSQDKQFTGPLQTLRATMAKEGVLALYKGTLPRLLGVAPLNVIQWGSYSTLKARIDAAFPVSVERQMSPEPHYGRLFAAGFGTGLVQTAFACPAELVCCSADQSRR